MVVVKISCGQLPACMVMLVRQGARGCALHALGSLSSLAELRAPELEVCLGLGAEARCVDLYVMASPDDDALCNCRHEECFHAAYGARRGSCGVVIGYDVLTGLASSCFISGRGVFQLLVR